MSENISKKQLWTGRILSGVIVIFMLFDSLSKIFKAAPVVEGTVKAGFAEHHIIPIGILGLVSTIIYAIPRTTVLGAILLTAYFGGAVASNLRLDTPLFSYILFPVYFGILTWGGVWFRELKVRALIPYQKSTVIKKDNDVTVSSETVQG